MPTVPSAQEIGPGQPGSATTAFAAAGSIFWFVTGPKPPGNTPSMITRSFTLPRSWRTLAIPSAVTSSHHFEKSVSMMMRGADGDAVAALDEADTGIDVATSAAPETTATARAPHTRALVVIIGHLHL